MTLRQGADARQTIAAALRPLPQPRYVRGHCTVCGEDRACREDGTVFAHGGGPDYDGRTMVGHCAGSHLPTAEQIAHNRKQPTQADRILAALSPTGGPVVIADGKVTPVMPWSLTRQHSSTERCPECPEDAAYDAGVVVHATPVWVPSAGVGPTATPHTKHHTDE